MKTMKRWAIPAILLMVICVLPSMPAEVNALQLEVGPGRLYSTISDAISIAVDGDVITVYNGIYSENIFIEKGLVIQSAGEMASPVIMPKDPELPVFTILGSSVHITGLTVQGSSSSGILLSCANNCTIANNKVVNNLYGITLENYAAGNEIMHNEIQNNYLEGINVWSHARNNTISHNSVLRNNRGVYLWDVGNNEIFNNEIINSRTFGITLADARRNIISHNTISNINSAYCIEMTGACGNTLYSNTISNRRFGLRMDEASNDNRIYLNHFMNTTVSSGESHNTWHSIGRVSYVFSWTMYKGYLGNYWGIYTVSDKDGDGIGDEPHRPDPLNEMEFDDAPLSSPLECYVFMQSVEPDSGLDARRTVSPDR
ncbi:MAG: nitrous oxide reductase family maturation protein NosD [bacterium]